MFNIPIILGTTRPGNQSAHVARLIFEIATDIPEIVPVWVDPLDFNLPFDGNDEEVKDSRYTAIVQQADAFFVVIPEYNHSFPGTLKRLMDSELRHYNHKPLAMAGVSSGPWGGVRGIEAFVTASRETGLVPLSFDIQFPEVQTLFDDKGKLLDEQYIGRVKKILVELLWMAATLKHGREQIKPLTV